MTYMQWAMFTRVILAADHTGSGLDLSILGQYGLLGLIALALFLFTKTTVQRQAEIAESAMKRETERADRMEAEVSRLNALIAETSIPALLSAAKAVEGNTSLLGSMQREREIEAARRAASQTHTTS